MPSVGAKEVSSRQNASQGLCDTLVEWRDLVGTRPGFIGGKSLKMPLLVYFQFKNGGSGFTSYAIHLVFFESGFEDVYPLALHSRSLGWGQGYFCFSWVSHLSLV